MMLNTVPERPSNLEVLQSCSLLNSLTAEERSTLAEGSYMAYAERGEAIWLAGSKPEFVAIVGAGFVKLTKSTAQGQDVTIEVLGGGRLFGLLAVIEGRPYPLSAVAITNTWYLKIPSALVIPLYQRSDALKDQIVRTLAPQLRKAQDMMLRLSANRVEERIAALLFIVADAYGYHDERGLHLGAPLTRQDLSEMAGTTVETAIRIMSRWQKEGLVCTEHQDIVILDEDALGRALSS